MSSCYIVIDASVLLENHAVWRIFRILTSEGEVISMTSFTAFCIESILHGGLKISILFY